jgi:hypothetical protein
VKTQINKQQTNEQTESKQTSLAVQESRHKGMVKRRTGRKKQVRKPEITLETQ